MANGLRSIIRKAQRQDMALLARRNRFAGRLNVEELEDRIAPATTVQPGEYVTWNITGGTADWDDTDGILFLGANSGPDISIASVADDTAPVITIDATTLSNNDAIYIVSNVAIGGVTFSGAVPTSVTAITVLIASGQDVAAVVADAGADGDDDIASMTIDGKATGTATVLAGTSISGTQISNGNGDDPTQATDSALGTITMPTLASGHAGLSVDMHVIAGDVTADGGAITGITSTDTGIDIVDDSLIQGASITNGITWAGDVLANGANHVRIVGNTGTTGIDLSASTSGLSFGGVTVSSTGNFTVEGEGIYDLTITNGITISSSGGVSIDSDIDATNDGITSAVSIGDITLSSTGDLVLSGGDSGFGSTVSLGDIAVSGTGAAHVLVATSTSAAFTGALTIGSITNTNTGGGTIIIGSDSDATHTNGVDGTGNMSTITVNDPIVVGSASSGTAVSGAIQLGSTNAAPGTIGAILLDGIFNYSTDDGGDVKILGGNITSISSTGGLNETDPTGGTVLGDILITSTGTIGAISITDSTVTGDEGDCDAAISATSGFSSTIAIANDLIDTLSTSGGAFSGAITVSGDLMASVTAGSGNITSLAVTGNIDSANGAVTISATSGSITSLTAANIIGTDTGGAITIWADGNVALNVSGNITALDTTGGSDIIIYSDHDDNAAAVDTGDLDITVGGSISVAGGTNDIFIGNSNDGTAKSYDVSLTVTSAAEIEEITADNDVTLSVGSTLVVNDDLEAGTAGDMTLTFSGAATITDDVTAGGDITFSGTVGGALSMDALTSTNGSISAITATGAITIGSINADADESAVLTGTTTDDPAEGNVGNITAGGALAIGAIDASAGTIGNLTAAGSITLTGAIVCDSLGNITADNTGNTADITITDDITADTGSIGSMTADDDITIGDGDDDIVATTTIGHITANGLDTGTGFSFGAVTASIRAQAQTADANGYILKIISGEADGGLGLMYAIETDATAAQATFDVTIDDVAASDIRADVEMTNLTTTAFDLSFKTYADTAVDGDANEDDSYTAVNDNEFDVEEITFGSSTVTGGKVLDVVTIDGDFMVDGGATTVSLGANSSVNAMIVQGNFGDNASDIFKVDNLNVLACATVNSNPASTTFIAPAISAVTSATEPVTTAVTGTFVIPVDPTAGTQVFAGAAAGFLQASNIAQVGVGAADDNEASVQFTSGSFTNMTGSEGGITLSQDITADTDLSNIQGAINITGDISGALTLATTGLTAVTITGDVSGAVTVGTVTGAVGIGVGGTVSSNVTIASVGGALTLGDVATGVTVTVSASDYVSTNVTSGMAGATIGSVAVGSTITLPELANGGTVTITNDMLGTLNLTNAQGAAVNLTITGDFGSDILVTGSIATLTLTDQALDGTIGSATSTITVTESLSAIDLNVAANANIDYVSFLSNLVIGSTGVDGLGIINSNAGPEPIAYTGTFSIGVNDGATIGLGIDTNADDEALMDGAGGTDVSDFTDAGEVAFSTDAGVAAIFGTATYDATNGYQVYAFTDIVLLGAGNTEINGNVSGNIYSGDNLGAAIDVDDPTTTTAEDGTVTGSIIVDDDADVSALGLTAGGDMAASFNGGLTKAATAAGFDLDLGALGGITVEGAMSFTNIDINTGNLGNITAGGAIAGTAITVDAGNLGLMVADGAITTGIGVDEAYTFEGIINVGGGYTGAFNVEGTVNTLFVNGLFNDTLNTYDPSVISYANVDADGAVGDPFAIAGYTCMDGIDVTGATAMATLNAGDLTIEGLAAGSTVTVDESDTDHITDDVTVVGDLAGDISITGDFDDLFVQGDWTGSVTLANTNSYNTATPTIDVIQVWGDVSTAALTGAAYNTAIDFMGNPLSAATQSFNGSDDPVQVGTTNQWVYVSNSHVEVVMSVSVRPGFRFRTER